VAAEARLARVWRDEAIARTAAGGAVLVPLGALEQHGPHLPVGTDAFLAEAVCVRAAGRAARDVLVAPALWSGFSPHHMGFGATVTLRPETLLALLRDVVASIATWCDAVLVVNGHGGNRGPLTTLGLEDGPVRGASYWELIGPELAELCGADHGSPGHAGQMETSLMLAVAPELVRAPTAFEPVDPANTALLAVELGPSGVIGDPTAASAELGRALLDAAADALARLVDALPPTAAPGAAAP
jgi:creatinine amidohydrolase